MNIPACCLFSQIFQWDLAIIILAAFLGMIAISVWFLRNHYRLLPLLGIWFLFLMIVIFGSWRVYNEENALRQTWQDMLLGMTNSFTNTTEIMGHAQIAPEISPKATMVESESGKESESVKEHAPILPETSPTYPVYRNIRNLHARWCKNIPFVARVYTLRLRDDKADAVSWVVCCEADVNNNHRIEKPEEIAKHPFQHSHEWLEIYRKGFDGNTVLADEVRSTQYGNFITAIAPLRDPEHPEFVEAILGVDFRVDRWNQMIGQLRWASLQFLIVILSFYLLAVYLITVLYRNISQLTTANQELIHAKKITDAAAKVRNDSMANMNHNIRTPMNVVVGFTDILMHRLQQSGLIQEWEESKGILEIIQKNSQDLLTIINDFLDFSQIEANLLQIESVPLSLKQLIDDIGQMEMPRISEKKLSFSIHYKNVPELIMGDPIRLRQILINLVDNAFKFTSQGNIEIRCETSLSLDSDTSTKVKSKRHSYPESTILKISIHDTGIGISPEQMEYLFKPFAADHSLTQEFGGTGLGLSITKRLAQLMDGDITVKSEPNIGSVFTLKLHVYLPSKQEFTVTPEKKHLEKSVTDLSFKPHSEAVRETVNNTEPENISEIQSDLPLKNLHILLVEDMKINQMVISAQLRNAGAKVEVADNGELGIQKIVRDMDNGLFFDIVLMDMQMPVKDGYEATAQLRSQGYHRPIIAVTAHALTGDREKTIAVGCDDYISKPVDRKILIDTIKKYLK
ncbi:MAG: response regulator [Planctomycetaceae bacterium]|jgi:signal transduction histidine kinase/ActR/RegA family two-component response regulator|nr:response regulator [Planctomycetaceae bacterium]